MEVHTVTVNSLHCTVTELSSLKASTSAPASPKVTSKKNISNNAVSEATIIERLNHSSTCELEKEYNELKNWHGSLTGNKSVGKRNGSLSGDSSTTSATPGTKTMESGVTMSSASAMASLTVAPAVVQIKKRISSSRTPARKAHRIKFFRNGDRFYSGITIPVSNERYRSFESLYEDLTRLLEESVKIPGAVRTIYSMCGKKINTLDELEDGQSYVCSCNNEQFKKVEYNTGSQPLVNLTLSNNSRSNNQRLAKNYRPASPLKNGSLAISNGPITVCGGGPDNRIPLNASRLINRDTVVHPRIVTLIRNGTKPRHIMRLLLNKRNSPSFEHVLTAITQVVRLDTGYVRKVFTLSGISVVQLADFFGPDDIFFAYGTERINTAEDFKLEAEEQRAINVIRKTLRTAGTTYKGPKPKMPIKSKKAYPPLVDSEEFKAAPAPDEQREAALLKNPGIELDDLPVDIRDSYTLGQIIGDGNFAIVLKIMHRQTGNLYALKIIDKNKCKGKEHYIDAEVRVMKKLDHPNIISLIMNVDKHSNMYLVLEYVSGGDLFDAITQATRFSESQSRIMIRHLASAMSYLHSMGIVHRDIKPENLLVELDEHGNVLELKLADFGLACEVNDLLFAVCGTPTYVAPEILLEVGYGLKIYSYRDGSHTYLHIVSIHLHFTIRPDIWKIIHIYRKQ
ncbi:serine/threonine-protein kinase GE16371 isoform X2 [Drosophila suzukii]|uniref:non-specific serine/threonine protein kinase n=1 Tax=Drosophila suzukii TaxID=28584 RepID=A0ABM4TYU0_DROSZ